MRPLRTRHRSAAIVVAASDVLEHRLFGRRLRRLVTMMGALAQTASMLRRSFRLHRHRDNGADERDQQQKSGGNPLHVVWWAKTSIWLENKAEFAGRQVSGAKRHEFCQDREIRSRSPCQGKLVARTAWCNHKPRRVPSVPSPRGGDR